MESIEVDIESVTLPEVDVADFRVLAEEKPRGLDVGRLPTQPLHHDPAQVLQVMQSVWSKEVLHHLELSFLTVFRSSWMVFGSSTELLSEFLYSCR